MSGVLAIYAPDNLVPAHMPDINGMQDASRTNRFESQIKKIQPVVRHQTPQISRSGVNGKPRAGTPPVHFLYRTVSRGDKGLPIFHR